jgi:hypothetical protein
MRRKAADAYPSIAIQRAVTRVRMARVDVVIMNTAAVFIDPYCTVDGFTFQISAVYCAIVRSLENFPELAMFAITLRVQPS